MAQHDSPKPDSQTAAKAGRFAGIGGKLAGLSKRLPSKKVMILSAAGLLFVLLPAFVLPRFLPKPTPKPKIVHTLAQAFSALDAENYEEASRIADLLGEEDTLSNDELGGPPYIRGAVAAHQAQMLWGKDQIRYHLLAARHLQQSEALGFPEGREEAGLEMLGKSLFESDQFVAARPVLEKALKGDPADSASLHGMLMNLYLHGADRDLKKALAHSQAYLSDPDLTNADRQAGLLVCSEIQLSLEDLPGCRETVEKISVNGVVGAGASVIRGQMLMQEAANLLATATDENRAERTTIANQKYDDAIAVFRNPQARSMQATDAARRSMYLIGLCYAQLGNVKAAIDQWARTAKMHMERPEGVAANLQMAEALRKMGRDDEAIEAYRNATSYAGDPQSYANNWISLSAFRDRLNNAYQQYQQAENYERALQMTGLMNPLMPPEKTVEMAAQSHEAWARAILNKAENRSPDEVRASERQAREQLRNAGAVYAQLASLRYDTRDYTEAVWKSGQSYFEGHDYRSAVKTFDAYLRFELRKRRPRVLVSLAECQLSLGHLDPALAELQECLEFYPTDAASYQARLLASRAYLEQNNLKQAESLLHENLDGTALAPASREWRDSLFALGRVLHISGQQEAAVNRLEEAVERYPDAPQTLEARYLIAESYRQSASIPRQKLASDNIETSRVAHARQLQDRLKQALTGYERCEQFLSRRQQQSELTSLEQSILRNCYFARASALFDLGRYEEAIQAYSTATNRYQYAPESLEAYVQIATCYRRLNRNDKARGTLEQAKVVLSRIKPDADYLATTNYSQQDWAKLLDWLKTL